MKQHKKIIVLAFLLFGFIAGFSSFSMSLSLNGNISVSPSLASTNFTVGVLPNEEYVWIITALNERSLELAFGSDWTKIFGLPENLQLGYKFKANVNSTPSNGTHSSLNFVVWNGVYRIDTFSTIPDGSDTYNYPIYPKNYTENFELGCLFPLFLPENPVSYLHATNLTGTYYTADDMTYYGGGLYVQYDRRVNISESPIDLTGVASYLENGVLDRLRFYFENDTDSRMCLTIEAIKPFHLVHTSIPHQVGEEFSWVLVNYNLSALDYFFDGDFFETSGLPPNPERLQKLKLKVDAVDENNTYWWVNYSLYDWTLLEDLYPFSFAQNSSYKFAKEPFNETREKNPQIPFLIPKPTDLFLRYGRFGDDFVQYYDMNRYLYLRYRKGEDELFGHIFYNPAGVLTSMVLSRSIEIGGRLEGQVAFELELCYNSSPPEYIGIEEGMRFEYDIYTNETLDPHMPIPTRNYEEATIEVVKIFGEDMATGRTPVIANFSLHGTYNLWKMEEIFTVGYVHNDSNMYFDRLIASMFNPFLLAPMFVSREKNWTEFTTSYRTYSMFKNFEFYSISELQKGFSLHIVPNNVKLCYKYNQTGILSEFTVYNNDKLYHNCSLSKVSQVPIIIVNDTDPPDINVITPVAEGVYGTQPLEFKVVIGDDQLNCSWLTVSNGTVTISQDLPISSGNSVVELSGQVSESAWNSFSDGNISVIFYANDSSGNLNWSEVVVSKDATAPIVSVLNLISGETFNVTPPEFDLNISELHINSTWYVVNGSEIVYFSGTSGTIDQRLWDALQNGTVLIQFFVMDNAGNLGTVEVLILKNIEPKLPEPSPIDPDDPTIPGMATMLIVAQLLVSIILKLTTTKNNKKFKSNPN